MYMFTNIDERVVFLFHVLIEFTVIAGKIVICLRDEKLNPTDLIITGGTK